MISMVSIVLALAVTFNTAIPVAPGNPGNHTGSLNIFEKPRLDAFQKILPGKPKSRPENLRIVSVFNFKIQNRLKVLPSIIGNTSLFQGRTYDPEVGLYYYRNRYYHPELGRFLQRDPNGYEDSMNLYQAFGLNPVNFTDPFGENVYIEVTPSGSGMKDRLSLGQFWYALRQDYSREDAISIIKASQGYGPITDEQIMALEVGAMTQPFKVYVGGAGLMMFEWSPAGLFKDLVSMPFGKDLVYDTKLQWYEYGLTATGVGGKLFDMFKIGKVAKLGDNISDLGNLKPISKAEMAENIGAGTQKSLYGLSNSGDLNKVTKVKKSVFDIVDPRYRKMVSEAFEGEPKLIKLKEDLIVYRRWGGKSKEIGSPWFALKEYKRVGNAKRYTALPGCNTAVNLTKFKIPAGTTILKGKTASQIGIPGFGNYAAGKGIQIYVPDPSVAIKIK